ncbi:MAG: hypothetical protein KGD73_12250 [Candidatus Lokiarchaeota archaeon]|nr:hypothetical protein [Candidatus Lokiarchaeota archaeon]
MSEDPLELTRIANKRFSELLSDGFRLFVKNWLKIIVPISVFYVISLLLRIVLLANANWNLILLEAIVAPLASVDPSSLTETQLNSMISYILTTWGIDTLNFIIGAVFTTLGLCSVAVYLYKDYNGEKTSLKESIKGAFNSKLIAVILILALLIPLGNFMLAIPAIIIFGFYIFSIYTYQLDDNNRSIKEAKILSKGAFWKIIGTFLVTIIITLIVVMFYQFAIEIMFPVSNSTLISWYDPANFRFELIFLYNLMNNVVSILFEPLFICLLTPLFTHMKARRNLGYNHHQREHSYQRVYQPSTLTQPEYTEKGIFCPFCGQHMDFKLKFCPSCGESIEFLTK